VVDADEAIRRSAHHLLGVQGAVVETARDGHEAVALMRQTQYSAALVDIRLPDLDGYAIFHKLHEVQPQTPVILMTGFGYDPTHSIVKARQEGLQTVLYKPFRSDRLMEAVEQALRIVPAGSAAHASASEDAARQSATTTTTSAEPVPAADDEQGQPGSPPSASADTDGRHDETRSTEALRHEP
jgi:DNA-binding NtrC family response regulator